MMPDDIRQIKKTLEIMVKAYGVRDVWNLDLLLKEWPAPFAFDVELAYSMIAAIANAQLKFSKMGGVQVNVFAFSDVFGVPIETVKEHLIWLARMGVLASK